jgi:hypothetical protein
MIFDHEKALGWYFVLPNGSQAAALPSQYAPTQPATWVV